MFILGLATLSLAIGSTANSVTVYDPLGVPVSEGNPAAHAPATILSDVIDRWQGDTDIYEWSINTTFYWATAFDTDDISETHDITEVRWYATGTGLYEEYWIAPDADGQPDTGNATWLGEQYVDDDGVWGWHSHDASAAEATVEPGRVYWFIRAKVGLDGFDMTWRSTTNPSPPVDDPVWISQSWDSGWSAWAGGNNWHMEYEILGNAGGGDCDLRVVINGAPTNVSRGGQLRFEVGARNDCDETLRFNSAVMDITGPASASQTLYNGAPVPVPEGSSRNASVSVGVPMIAPTGIYNVALTLYRAGNPIDQEAFDVQVD